MTETVDLALGILDHQLVDADERRCGKVDDLELEGVSKGTPEVAAILAGSPVWAGRGRLGRVASLVGRGTTVRIPWQRVAQVDSAVHLRGRAAEFGLARGDDRARGWIERLPGAR
jgi:hypothetical protein